MPMDYDEIENLEMTDKSCNVSIYQPSSQESSTEESNEDSADIDDDISKKKIVSSLEKFLQHANLQPLGGVLTRSWDAVSKKTQSHYR